MGDEVIWKRYGMGHRLAVERGVAIGYGKWGDWDVMGHRLG